MMITLATLYHARYTKETLNIKQREKELCQMAFRMVFGLEKNSFSNYYLIADV